jgi:hypothetical protein
LPALADATGCGAEAEGSGVVLATESSVDGATSVDAIAGGGGTSGTAGGGACGGGSTGAPGSRLVLAEGVGEGD